MIFKFLKGLVTEEDGKPSFSRVAVGTTLLASLTWISYIVFAKGVLPDMTTLALFFGAVGTTTYGFNQAKAAAIAIAGTK